MSESRPRRVSVSVREGPAVESRQDKHFKSSVNEIFQCCENHDCQEHVHRKSLSASEHLSKNSWTRVDDIPRDLMPYAMERAVMDGNENRDSLLSGSTSMEEIMDDFLRAKRCLKTEYKAFAAVNFDRLMREDMSRAMTIVWPALREELLQTATLNQFCENFHEPTAKKLPFTIVELYKMGKADEARQLLELAFTICSTSPDMGICSAWVDCIEKLVKSCNSADIQKDIFPFILDKMVGGSSTVYGRVGACRVLRCIAARFNHDVIQKKLLPIMETFSKDKHPLVRAAAAASLPEMFLRIKKKGVALKIINIFKVDTESNVKTALTATLVQSVILMNPEEPRNKEYLESVMQTIKGLVKEAYVKGNLDLLVGYSGFMGRVSLAFHKAGIMHPRDTLWYLDAFLQLSRYNAKLGPHAVKAAGEEAAPPGFANFRANMQFNRRQSIVDSLISTKLPSAIDKAASESASNTQRAIAVLRANAEQRRMSVPYGGSMSNCATCSKNAGGGPSLEKSYECRANAAKEFYEFTVFAMPIVDFRHGLHLVAVDLMHDTNPEVRTAMAKKLLPIMEYLGPEAALMHGEFVFGLTDDDLGVIEALVPNISKILKCLAAAKVISPDRVTPKLVEIGGAIMYCEERLNQTTYYKVHQTTIEQFASLPFYLPCDYIYANFVPALFHRLRHMRQIPCRMAAGVALVIYLRHCRRASQRDDIRKKIITGFAHGRSVHDRMLFIYIAKKVMEKFSRKYFRDYFFEEVLLLANDPVVNVRRKAIEMMPELSLRAGDQAGLKKIEETFIKCKKQEVDRDVKETIEITLDKLRSYAQVLARRSQELDAEDEAKRVEEEYIASLEQFDGQSKNVTVEEKRKNFFGAKVGARKSKEGGGLTTNKPHGAGTKHPKKIKIQN